MGVKEITSVKNSVWRILKLIPCRGKKSVWFPEIDALRTPSVTFLVGVKQHRCRALRDFQPQFCPREDGPRGRRLVYFFGIAGQLSGVSGVGVP